MYFPILHSAQESCAEEELLAIARSHSSSNRKMWRSERRSAASKTVPSVGALGDSTEARSSVPALQGSWDGTGELFGQTSNR
jgi:hypothetical protein